MVQWIQLLLAWRLPSTYPTLCCKEIRVTPKISVLPSGTLSQTLDVENFATVSRSSLGVVNEAHRRTGA